MRILVAHHYPKADNEIVWTVLVSSIPELVTMLELDRVQLPDE